MVQGPDGTLYGTTRNGGTNVLGGTVFAFDTNNNSLTILYTFTDGADGAQPIGPLLLESNTLYGTASIGGTNGDGTVFSVNTDGTGFTVLHTFNGLDGQEPCMNLILSGNTLYSTAPSGGTNNDGTVFAINTDGTGFTNLYSFSGNDGSQPGNLVLSGNMLYGATADGGTNSSGTVFAIHTDGTGFTNLYEFDWHTGNFAPAANLILSGGVLYGAAMNEGINPGSIFAINTNGTDFHTLYYFTNGDNEQAWEPNLSVASSSGMLYGTTEFSQTNWGIIFAINTNGSNYSVLYTFTHGTDEAYAVGLTQCGNIFYGAALPYYSDPLAIDQGNLFALTLPPPTVNITSGSNLPVLNCSGISNFCYQVQSSTNLTAWTTLWTTNAPPGGSFQFTDGNAPQPAAFYRLQWNP